jgi:hemerythrin-like domain-containing protein
MMDNELKELLRSVLKEELEPINNRLYDIEINVKDLNKDVKDIKTGQEKLQKNIIESLGQYTEKIADHVDDKTAVLNKRVYAVETEIQRLTRQ